MLSLALAVSAASAAEQPNIILFVIDDLGFADLSLKNSPARTGGGTAKDFETLFVDELAADGLLMDAYYVNRLCSPTRTSLLSSRYAYNLGLAGGVITNGFPVALRLNESCIAQHMKAIGYQTHAFGKWDAGYHTWAHTPTHRGFDTWLGYYNADEDYITHSCGGGTCGEKAIDLRNNTDVLEDNSTYSTLLYTAEGVRAIDNHDSSKGPFFLYAAYQAVHGPLEAPQNYLDQCTHITEHDRHIFCGMVLAMDEGVKNITDALKRNGMYDNTIIALTTDNGGQNGVGGNNWPLRGNKATVFEGGVRGQGLVWGGKDTALGQSQATASSPRNHLFGGLMHNVDWGPTLFSAGGGNASSIIATHRLDGVDVWPSLLGAAAAAPGSAMANSSPRKDVLLHLQGPDNGHILPMPPPLSKGVAAGAQPTGGWEKTAALRSGQWKVVVNQVESQCPPGVTVNASGQSCLKRATGWVKLGQSGSGDWDVRTFEAPGSRAYEQTCDNRTCLFNLHEDPTERHDVSAQHPDVVAQLMARIAEFNRTLIPNIKQPFDTKSCPRHFPNNAWTPWLNATPPLPPPPRPHPEGNVKLLQPKAGVCIMSGWCSGPGYSGPALLVRVLLDGVKIANQTASLHRQKAGDHGFSINLDCSKLMSGHVKLATQTLYGGNWTDLAGSPECLTNGKVASC